MELTCIVCPVGCPMVVEPRSGDSAPDVSGNLCPRGAVYANEETRAPKRAVTATCAIAATPENGKRGPYAPRRVPVKTSTPCPREKIPALLADIYGTKISLPVKPGDVVIANWNDTGIDVVATRTLA